MKNRIPLVFIMLLGVSLSYAQNEKKAFIRKGLFRAQGTISPGIMVKENVSTISLHGNIEYYAADNVSVRSEAYFYLNGKDTAGNDPLMINHSIISGASYHFKTKSNFDPYLALAPGFAIVQDNSFDACMSAAGPNVTASVCKQSERTVNPIWSTGIGFNFYFQRWFHLFGEARYIGGKYLSDATKPMSLSELRFSFGLGWNINFVKIK